MKKRKHGSKATAEAPPTPAPTQIDGEGPAGCAKSSRLAIAQKEIPKHSDALLGARRTVPLSPFNGVVNDGCVSRICAGAVGEAEVRQFVSA